MRSSPKPSTPWSTTPRSATGSAGASPRSSASGTSDAPREELFTAWRRFVEALAYEGRLVLIFEDLHWADVPMLEFIEHLIDEGERPFMVVCAASPELYDRLPTVGRGPAQRDPHGASAADRQ